MVGDLRTFLRPVPGLSPTPAGWVPGFYKIKGNSAGQRRRAIYGWKLAGGINAYLTSALALSFELDNSVNLRKQGVISTHTHVSTRMKLCAHLSHQNISGPDRLPTKSFDSTSLGRAVTAVSRASSSFFVCHGQLPRH